MIPACSDPVVVVDDDPDHLDMLVTLLERAGFAAAGFADPRDALYYLIDHPASLAVIDLNMPNMDGLELSRRLQTSRCDLPFIGISGARDLRSRVFLRALSDFGAKVCLRKPVDPKRFIAAIEDVLARGATAHTIARR